MKKIEKGSIKYLILLIILFSVVAMILYPIYDLIYDLIYDNFITHSKFVYTFQKYIIEPIIFGFICGTIFWVIDKK